MKRVYCFFCGALLAGWAGAQESYLRTDFNQGIPSAYTTISLDQNPVSYGSYNHLTPMMEWFDTEVYGTDGKAAVSVSRRVYDAPTDNWLITPQLTIASAEAWLRWNGRSVHHGQREDYKVMISVTDAEPESFVELCRIEAEAYAWQTHVVSLSAYQSQKVYVAFVHTSQQKFMLAIDDVSVGELTDVDLAVDNHTRRFCGQQDNALVEGLVRNQGGKVRVSALTCTVDGNATDWMPQSASLATGDEWSFRFDIPVSVGKASVYTLAARLEDGTSVPLLTDSIICSYYPRTLLLEKATATWCTSCPTVIPFVNELKDRFADEVVDIEVHSYSYGDPFGFQDYVDGLGLANFPTLLFNRCKYEQNGDWRSELLRPTKAQVSVQASFDEEGRIDVHTTSEFAQEIDNAKGIYRLGFAVLEKHIPASADWRQTNGQATSLRYQEYYYLPTLITDDLMDYHNVARGTSSVCKGVPSSLPAQLKAGEEYVFDITLDQPELAGPDAEVSVVAILFNRNTDEVLNVACTDVDAPSSSVGRKPSAEGVRVYADGGSYVVGVPGEGVASLTLYAPDGRVCRTWQTEQAESRIPTQSLTRGCYLLGIGRGNSYQTVKIIIQ